jgi:hypothetical protein
MGYYTKSYQQKVSSSNKIQFKNKFLNWVTSKSKCTLNYTNLILFKSGFEDRFFFITQHTIQYELV